MAKKGTINEGNGNGSRTTPQSMSSGDTMRSGNAEVSATGIHTPSRFSPEEIAARAYTIYDREGRVDGKDMDHWLRAEQELQAERQHGRRDPSGQYVQRREYGSSELTTREGDLAFAPREVS
jgi:hypothetical protein